MIVIWFIDECQLISHTMQHFWIINQAYELKWLSRFDPLASKIIQLPHPWTNKKYIVFELKLYLF